MKLLPLLLLLCSPAFAQWQPLSVNTKASFRAVSAASKRVVWIGGSAGTFLRTTDGGDTWQTGIVAGAETCDFRDVQAIDAQTAILMSAGPAEQGQARIYRTTNGGQSWTLSYQTQQQGVFFDGLSFWNARQGIAFSDPVAGRYFLVRTDDGGQTWQPLPVPQSPPVHAGEAAFAASGSSIVTQGAQNVWIGSGGVGGGRVFRSTNGGQSWAVSETGLPADSSSGVFGLHFFTAKDGIAVGGDHKNVTKPGPNVAITNDGGKTWSLATPATSPGESTPGESTPGESTPGESTPGLKEAAWRLPNGHWLLVGPSGTSLSTDAGKTWQALDQEPFHALVCAGNTCWAVGGKGRVARRTF